MLRQLHRGFCTIVLHLNQWWVGITRTEVPVQASVSSDWSSSVGLIGSIGIVSVWLCIGKLAIVILFGVIMCLCIMYVA